MADDTQVEGVPVEQRPGLLRINPQVDPAAVDTALSTPNPVKMTPDLADLAAAQQAGGRFSPLAKIASDYFLPFSNLRNPDTPETRQAYDQALQRAHQAGGGKVPQAPGSPVLSPGVAGALDLAGNVGGKVVGAVKGLGALKGLGAIKSGALPLTGWISHRWPTAVGATEHPVNQALTIGTDVISRDPQLLNKMAATVAKYPNMTDLDRRGTPDQVVRNFQNHIVENLLWMYDRIPPDIRQRSARWYEGANGIARGAADYYGIPLTSTSAVFAALSPKKDWYQNADLGRRLLDIYFHHSREKADGRMLDKIAELYGSEPDVVAALAGKRLVDLPEGDQELKGLWVRAWDETHNDPSYPIIAPEGESGDYFLTKGGTNRRITWAARNAIGKAIEAIDARGDLPRISAAMGQRHKVRSFYNNIFDPWSPMGDVTIDTHAVAAGLLRPLSLDDIEVLHNLSGPPKAAGLGVVGTYGVIADAYRRAAEARGVLPRQMQSITWEGGRGLFQDTFKTATNKAAIEKMWRDRGQRAMRQIQDQIEGFAGGIDPPDWY
jgi:hypothetical protein